MRLFGRRLSISHEVESAGRFDHLMPEVSRGSREAFAELYDATCDDVRAELAHACPDQRAVDRLCGAVYVEVWWLAGCYTANHGGVRAWIGEIVRRRVADGFPASVPAGTGAGPLACSGAELELADLLGRPPGRSGGVS